MDIPPSQTNKQTKLQNECNVSFPRHCPKKIRLKIITGNEKDSFNETLHKIKWKSIFDVKRYILERNSKYTYKIVKQ